MNAKGPTAYWVEMLGSNVPFPPFAVIRQLLSAGDPGYWLVAVPSQATSTGRRGGVGFNSVSQKPQAVQDQQAGDLAEPADQTRGWG
jgi:hypothetical protein